MATSYCRSPARVGGINLLHEYETPLKSIPTYHSEARYPVERRGSLRQSKQTTMLVAVFLAVLAW